ncbi:MAG: hypothetical protein J5736_04250 [Bacilli bacterium]|nr:hypothetical protein [Bacilli bacterium]
MHSEYADKMDDLSYIDSFLSSGDVYSGVERSLKMDRGMVYSPSIMHWAGYFYRAFAYLYELRSPWLFKQIPLSYLASVYPAYHSLDIRKAILNVIEAKGLSNYENDLWKRTLLALRKSINRV